jgi:hypothetical protein
MDADDQLRLSRFVIEQSNGGSLSDGCHDHIVIAECS